jgi:hypothetical protein
MHMQTRFSIFPPGRFELIDYRRNYSTGNLRIYFGPALLRKIRRSGVFEIAPGSYPISVETDVTVKYLSEPSNYNKTITSSLILEQCLYTG